MSSNQLILLGTGTCQLLEERIASSVLLELDGRRIVYDFGRGVATRLTSLGYRQDDVEHIVLSHFHADHVSDLIPYLHAASYSQVDPRERDLHIYGPPGLRERLGRLFSFFEGRELLSGDRFSVRLHEMTGGPMEIDGLTFDWVELPPAGNHGLGFEVGGERYALTGDSSFHAAEVAFLRGAALAVFDSGHLSDREIVELAVATGARRLVASHAYRDLDVPALTTAARAEGYTGELILGEDAARFEL